MQITNRSNRNISMSVNKWGKRGDTDWNSLSPGETEYWDRSDERGFIMGIIKNGERNSYFIFANSSVFIYEDYIEDFGRKIKPATDRYLS
ncbi:hypothetical protein [Xenorhabdus japonica]|uniref:Uncharacterized protein n=1 Tax=Xenorhabdus japonica TaxID=53341 RepID=A0A1I5AXQ1_9GAMM|nr:hypothetical protein [Xenorhabdus japonica]SFN67180.1 hypothetical protein SAMN05421579_11472 [Xenorhabdus japonica]